MLKQLEGARLGVFIFLASVIFVVVIFLIGNKESLFTDTISVRSYFTNVEGLKSGAPVRLSGMDIGSVKNVALVDDTSGRVEVELRIEEESKHLVRLDSRASIETEGLVGKKVVTVTPGSPELEAVSDGSLIQSKDPVMISQIIAETQNMTKYLSTLTKDLSDIIAKVNQGQGTLGKVINDDQLYYSAVNLTQTADTSLADISVKLNEITNFITGLGSTVENIVANLDRSIVKIDSTASGINNLVNRVERGEGVLGALIADRSSYDSIKTAINNLVKTAKFTKQGAEGFMENMEALKHNWLFKSYFEERGYWDKTEYEKELDQKLQTIEEKNEKLDQKIRELNALNEKLKKMQNRNE
jgi:phospholipid/cholesterol/gamma-HCH transport system substrate-binding protein